MTDLLPIRRALPIIRGDAPLEDHPINPDWVLEGQPQARIRAWAESADRTTSQWVWDCTAGRFRWYYPVEESIVIIAGSVTLQAAGEEPVTLGVGDGAYFTAGQWMNWDVQDYVRKHATVRVPVPRGMRYAVNGFGRRQYRL